MFLASQKSAKSVNKRQGILVDRRECQDRSQEDCIDQTCHLFFHVASSYSISLYMWGLVLSALTIGVSLITKQEDSNSGQLSHRSSSSWSVFGNGSSLGQDNRLFLSGAGTSFCLLHCCVPLLLFRILNALTDCIHPRDNIDSILLQSLE
jgi:hypothetical protein